MRGIGLLSLSLGLATLGGAAARASEFKDCPLVGVMPDYAAEADVQLLRWDGISLRVKDGDNEKDVVVEGAVCRQSYAEKPGKTEGSLLEYTENFKDNIQQLGGELKLARDGYVVGVVKNQGKDVWIRVTGTRDDGYTVEEVTVTPFTPSLLPPSGYDYRLLGHMPTYVASEPNKKNFTQYNFPTDNGDLNIRGRLYQVHYEPTVPKPQTEVITREEVISNYRYALHNLGAEMLRDSGFGTENLTARFDDHGQLIYIYVDSRNVTAMEEKPFRMTIQPPTADAMKDALDKAGRIALYVNFDFAKASLKPDAAPIVAEVVNLMKRNPDLKLSIDGHTDNIGGHDYNQKLSQDRAASVVAAVVAGGVDSGRLQSHGFGADKPIAPNDTEEGRAKNRRVELVKAP